MINLNTSTSIAIHAVTYIAAKTPKAIQVKEIATLMKISENHLAKVLQKLVRKRLLKSIRGPRGGFILAKDPQNISFLDIYQAIEGKFQFIDCLLGQPFCDKINCIFGDLIKNCNTLVYEYFKNTTLDKVLDNFKNLNP